MMTIGEISRQYGIPVSTINSAVDANLLDMEIVDGVRRINDTSEKFCSWFEARFQQSRVKNEAEWVQELASYARAQKVRMATGTPSRRYAVVEPINILFTLLEEFARDLDFAQATSVGEIDRVTGCGLKAAEEFVSRFYVSIGGAQADQYKVTRLISRQALVRSAYLLFYENSSSKT